MEKKAELIKKALSLVDKLASYDIDDFDNYDNATSDFEELQKLISDAKKVKNNNLWKL
jgi:hypothetical protein